MPTEKIYSPLIAESTDIELIKEIDVKSIISDWETQFKINVKRFFYAPKIKLYRCRKTGLDFFSPINELVGDKELYESLSFYSNYYDDKRWEFDLIENEIIAGRKVLEIGSGEGLFLKRLMKKGAICTGLDLNERAVAKAQSNGIHVEYFDLYEYSKQHTGEFDIVCGFHVIEHLDSPGTFFSAALNLLKPGGHIILSTPNSNALTGSIFATRLNMPPHHVTLWTKKTVQSLSKVFQVNLEYIKFEPASSRHSDAFATALTYKFLNIKYLRGLVYRFAKFIFFLACKLKLSFIKNPTILFSLKKREEL